MSFSRDPLQDSVRHAKATLVD